MHNLKICIEMYDPVSRNVFKLQQTISDAAYRQDPEVLEYLARQIAKQFNHEWAIERDNLQYAPKKSIWRKNEACINR